MQQVHSRLHSFRRLLHPTPWTKLWDFVVVIHNGRYCYDSFCRFFVWKYSNKNSHFYLYYEYLHFFFFFSYERCACASIGQWLAVIGLSAFCLSPRFVLVSKWNWRTTHMHTHAVSLSLCRTHNYVHREKRARAHPFPVFTTQLICWIGPS